MTAGSGASAASESGRNREYYPLHYIRWEHFGDGLRGVPTCDQAEGAWCRMTCPAGCESFDHEHGCGLEDAGYCNVVAWLTEGSDSAQDACTEELDGAPVRDGLIQPTWEGDFIGWHYPPEPTSASGDSASSAGAA